MNTRERLREYYPFAENTLDRVSEFADYQQSFDSYGDFFRAVQIPEVISFKTDGFAPLQVLDVRPKDHDERHAMFVHLPMANPLDANQIFQIATIAGTNPDKRIIAVGNPSGGGYDSGRLGRHERRRVVKNGLLTPLVETLERYADSQDIEVADHVGYSFGSLKAMISAANDDRETRSALAIEPVVGKRNLLKLGLNFGSTASTLEDYVRRNNLPTFEAARKDGLGMIGYNLGLLKLSNIAIAQALAVGNFEDRANSALYTQPEMDLTVAWGSESELATDGLMKAIVKGLYARHGKRVHTRRLPGQKHALANDLHLTAALVLDATK